MKVIRGILIIHWDKTQSQDVTIIMLGTNDYKNRVSIKGFVSNYRDMLTREIEEFGNYVILMTPIMMQDETTHSLLDDSIGLDSYRFATSNLAKEWNIPVIDL